MLSQGCLWPSTSKQGDVFSSHFTNTANHAAAEQRLSIASQITIGKRLSLLETTLGAFMDETKARLSNVEVGLASIARSVNTLLDHATTYRSAHSPSSVPELSEPRLPVAPNLSSPTICPFVREASVDLSLELSEHETRWFTKRPFPDFDVSLVDKFGIIQHSTPCSEIRVRAMDSSGGYVDQFLFGATLTFGLVRGRATISGVKFAAVSSRNGGYFVLELSIGSGPLESCVLPVRTKQLCILSERLKNESKVDSIFDLKGASSLLRVPGIGKKCRSAFAKIGVKTVRDLASVTEGSETMCKIDAIIEEESCALTHEKLRGLIRDAHHVVHPESIPSMRHSSLTENTSQESSTSSCNDLEELRNGTMELKSMLMG